MCLTVIICTHNPEKVLLNRTLTSLLKQRFTSLRWSLCIVDNASTDDLSKSINYEEFTAAGIRVAIIREEQTGLTHARLCGIDHASKSDWILFVDDDNVLAPDFLHEGLKIINAHPHLGCFGGSLVPEFESPPTPAMQPYLPALALREIVQAKWSNNYDFDTSPYGAGMWVKKEVAQTYYNNAQGNHTKLNLGRSGMLLGGCEDTDIAFTACDMGLACGLFPTLSLTHIIPKSRLNLKYLKCLTCSAGYSHIVLLSMRSLEKPNKLRTCLKIARLYKEIILSRGNNAALDRQFKRGQISALLKTILQMDHRNSPPV